MQVMLQTWAVNKERNALGYVLLLALHLRPEQIISAVVIK